ncbi:hypothetical protein C0992_011604, partial [Termitomyces sp. T32_za158]
PLDVGVFSPLASAWSDCCAMILEETGEGMELRYVVEEYMEAREKAFKKETIIQAWRKAGIKPARADSFQETDITPGIFTERDFAPSHSTSTQVKGIHQSTRLPRAPDASSDDFIPVDAPFDIDGSNRSNERSSKNEESDDDWEKSSTETIDTDLASVDENNLPTNTSTPTLPSCQTSHLETTSIAHLNSHYLLDSPSTPTPAESSHH